MPNYEMAQAGHSFSEGGIDLSWGLGREESDVVSVAAKDQTDRFKQRVLAGLIVESKRKPTKAPEEDDIREYKLLTGEEAAAVKAEPAGPVTRTVYDPDTGGTVQVEIMGPELTNAQLEAAQAFEKQQAAQLGITEEAPETPEEPPAEETPPETEEASETSPELA